MAELADAAQHAHSRGILHRDIKPSNILLTPNGNHIASGIRHGELAAGHSSEIVDLESPVSSAKPLIVSTGGLTPSRSPVPYCVRLTDFGLAKVFDEHATETRSGAVLGTADYMAPEQASGRVKDISVQTDVFAIGAILYELLSGRPPFRGRSTSDTLRRVIHEEPPRLVELWHDLQFEHYNRELQKSLTIQKGETEAADEQRHLAQERAKQIHRLTYAADLRLVQQFVESGDSAAAIELLKRNRPVVGGEDVRSFEWAYWLSQCYPGFFPLVGHTASVYDLDFSRDGSRLITGSFDKTARIWDVESERQVLSMPHPNQVYLAKFSPDGQLCATGSRDSVVRVWDAGTGQLLQTLRGHSHGLQFSRDGEWLITAADSGEIRVHRPRTGQLVRQLAGPPYVALDAMALSPNDRYLAVGGHHHPSRKVDEFVESSEIWIWDLTSMKDPERIELDGTLSHLSLNGAGDRLVVARHEGKFDVLEFPRHDQRHSVLASSTHESGVWETAQSPDGRIMLTVGNDFTVRLWQSPFEQFRDLPLPPKSKIRCGTLSSDTRTIAVGGVDGLLGTWKFPPPRPLNLGNAPARHLPTIPTSATRSDRPNAETDNSLKRFSIFGTLIRTRQPTMRGELITTSDFATH